MTQYTHSPVAGLRKRIDADSGALVDIVDQNGASIWPAVSALVSGERIVSTEAELIAALALGGKTVTLAADITLTTATAVMEDNTTLDLNGYRLFLANGVNKSLVTNSCWGVLPTTVTITSVGLVATVAWPNHGKSPDDAIGILGANEQAYNGTWRVATVVNANSLTYQMSDLPSAATATGTITAGRANKNLVVVNGTIDMNEANQTVTGSVETMAARFMNVLGFTHDRVKTLNAKKYGLLVANGTEINIPYAIFDTASDGCHLSGPIGTASIGTIEGKTGDDLFALTCGDYVTYAPCLGDIRNVTVAALKPRYALTAMKIAGLSGTKVHRVQVGAITGMTRRQALYYTNDTNLTSTNADVVDIGLIDVLHGQEVANTYPLIQIRGAVSGDAAYKQIKIGTIIDRTTTDTADLMTLADAVFGAFEVGTLISRNTAARKGLNLSGVMTVEKWVRVNGVDITPGNSTSAVPWYISAGAKGTGAGYLVNNGAGYAIGATTIALDTGTGTVLAGELIRFQGDPNTYTVATALSAGSLTLRTPLKKALADNTPMSIVTGIVRLELSGVSVADGLNTNAKNIQMFGVNTTLTLICEKYDVQGGSTVWEQNAAGAPVPNIYLRKSKWTSYTSGLNLRDSANLWLGEFDFGVIGGSGGIQLLSAAAGSLIVRGSLASQPASGIIKKNGGTWNTIRLIGPTLYNLMDGTTHSITNAVVGDVCTDAADGKPKMCTVAGTTTTPGTWAAFA